MNADELRSLFSEKTGKPWDPEEGVPWLMKNYEHLGIYTKMPVLAKTAHVTLSEKATWLSQHPCLVCDPGFPINVIPLRIEPQSWQSLDSIDKTAFKEAIAARMATGPSGMSYLGRVCLTFLFVCSAKRRVRDLDNMAKLVMDSLKGVIMGDDRDVDHLNLMRLTHDGEEEYVVFRIAGSNLNIHSDVVHPALRHSWAGQESLRLEDYRAA